MDPRVKPEDDERGVAKSNSPSPALCSVNLRIRNLADCSGHLAGKRPIRPWAKPRRTVVTIRRYATSEIGQSIPRLVILWRSKERSDAAQTIGSMP
ncbi:hypothetical protein FJ934_14190 [Mesorhizobium sp. B2-4-12]|nr:hypothetical protein FJ934_14190 [Mesorhizobium sp. B2-4-12]TPL03223.1 hypothetical protein FJ938_17955 [Mesorhizobium sp. B2-4-14]